MSTSQILLTNPFSPTITLNSLLPTDQILDLRAYISSHYNLPSSYLIFSSNSRILSNETSLLSLNSSIISLNFALKAGKGGFGSLLRGQAATKRKTTNFDSSKDLKGRRIRNVENEKKLKEFLKKKEEEDRDVEKRLKKYKDSEDKKHAKHYEQKLTQEYKQKLDDWEGKMGDSIAAGVRNLKRKGEEGKFVVPMMKKVCREENKESFREKEDGMICEEINEKNSNEKLGEKLKEKIEEILKENEEEKIDEKINEKLEEKNEKIDEKINEKIEEKINEKNDEKNGEKINEKIEEKIAEEFKEKEVFIEKIEENEKEIEKLFYHEIDLKSIQSLEDLETLGSEHLKQELLRLGLKCSGNLNEKAQRLYDIKKDPTNLFNPKYLAKVRK